MNEYVFYGIDDLQQTLSKKETIDSTELYLEGMQIDKSYTKVYLSAKLFVQFPLFFESMSQELLSLSQLVVDNYNLSATLIEYKTKLEVWKKHNSLTLQTELNSMKQKTKESIHEALDDNCVKCYQIQHGIIDVAYTYFDKVSSKTS